MFGLFKRNRIEDDPIIRQLQANNEKIDSIRSELAELNAQAKRDHEENDKFISDLEARMRARGIKF